MSTQHIALRDNIENKEIEKKQDGTYIDFNSAIKMSTKYYFPLFFRTIRTETDELHGYVTLFDDKGANCGKICVALEDLCNVIISLSEGEAVAHTCRNKDGNTELHIDKLGYDEDYKHSLISGNGEVTTFADIRKKIALMQYERAKKKQRKQIEFLKK